MMRLARNWVFAALLEQDPWVWGAVGGGIEVAEAMSDTQIIAVIEEACSVGWDGFVAWYSR